jgi:hypothetical protein
MMTNTRTLGVLALVATLTGCGGAETKTVAEPPAKLPPGEYTVTAKVDTLRSTDKTTPATKAKLGETVSTTGCVGADNQPAAELFAATGDKCTAKDSYVRSGRLNVSFACSRAGKPGDVMVSADGRYTADGFTGKATTNTYFAGDGDYTQVSSLTAKRVGQCKA